MMRRGERYDVAFYVPWISPLVAPDAQGLSTGGAETQTYLLSRALARIGLRVCLHVFEIPGARMPPVVDGVDVIVRPPFKALQPVLGKAREALSIRAALASVDADTIVSRSAGPHIGLIALFARDRRFVFSSANMVGFDSAQMPKRVSQMLFALGTRLADEIVVQTEEQLQAFRRGVGRTAVLIRSLCEPAAVSSDRPDAFIWIGRYAALKRPLEYVELARAIPEARFRMVASAATSTPEAVDLKCQVVEAAKGVPNLELFHSLPRGELMRLVERSVAVVSTSEFEGMSNALLEGWARGVPALVFSYDSDAIVGRRGLGYVAKGSRAILAEQARELWACRYRRHELSARCRDYVRDEHDPDRIAEQWAKVLAGPSQPLRREVVVSEGL
jgi:glycosyltransferase involved in cell wall biosynthesis